MMTFIANVFYKDARAALAWLEKAFGFETTLIVENPDGTVGHSEMSFGNGSFNLGGEWADWAKSPASVGGANTQGVSVDLASDIDGHCSQARTAGAAIVQEPADQPYGARTYRALDPEGHEWAFAQAVRAVTRQEMEAAGHRIEGADAAFEGEGTTFESQLFYRDVKAAAAWLEKAFGFETSLLIESTEGEYKGSIRVHMTFGGKVIALGNDSAEPAVSRAARRSPLSLGGANTQTVEVLIDSGVDEHFEQARASGAVIVAAPEDQFYGARNYRVLDPEGHHWTFSQLTREVSNEEMEQASGLKIRTGL